MEVSITFHRLLPPAVPFFRSSKFISNPAHPSRNPADSSCPPCRHAAAIADKPSLSIHTGTLHIICSSLFPVSTACIEVLKKCKEAIPPKTGKVLLAEMVIEEKGSSKNLLSKLYMDMDMMIIGGKERSRKNWEDMFDKAGFNHCKFIDIDELESIIEARP